MPIELERRRVRKAQRYQWGKLGSLGDASGMFLGQYNFPDEYDPRDIMTGADHDRCQMWDFDHFRKCCEKYMKTGELYISTYVREKAKPERVLSFLSEVLKVKEQYPKVKFTGWRVLGTVNRSNGYPVFTLELFAKHPDSDTVVWTGDNAPNIEGHGSGILNHIGDDFSDYDSPRKR